MQGALRAVEKKQLPHMLSVTNMLLHGIEDPSFVRHDNTLARPLISWGKDERVDIVLTNPPFGGREEDGIENNFPTFRTKETADLFLAPIVRLLRPSGRAAVMLPDGTLSGDPTVQKRRPQGPEKATRHSHQSIPCSIPSRARAGDRGGARLARPVAGGEARGRQGPIVVWQDRCHRRRG
ncbi:N-6 DNA methylase [Bradyrhizobium sp. CSA112]|uniref:HsdM family class I SAM-dependent methyltransferase n=1 Tax=Bradyrhizobium sp. CSA112 TaxID=2699170 RepID=UPI0023B137A0|nr:N-6 DNA methylase [Bradyrhizobium sp. CSA112]